MSKNFKTKFQNFHYSKQDFGFALKMALSLGEFFYKSIINFKNLSYKIGFKKEYKTGRACRNGRRKTRNYHPP